MPVIGKGYHARDGKFELRLAQRACLGAGHGQRRFGFAQALGAIGFVVVEIMREIIQVLPLRLGQVLRFGEVCFRRRGIEFLEEGKDNGAAEKQQNTRHRSNPGCNTPSPFHAYASSPDMRYGRAA